MQAWFKDIHDQGYKLIVWKDSVIHDVLRFAPSGSWMQRVYHDLFERSDPHKEELFVKDYARSIDTVLSERAVIMDSVESIQGTDEFKACKLARLTEEELPEFPIAIPLAKGWQARYLRKEGG